MDKNQFSSHWREYKGKIKDRWSSLTDNDIDHIHGKMDYLSEHLQKKYGWTKERANMEIQRFCAACEQHRTREYERNMFQNSAETAGFMEENPYNKNRGRQMTDYEKFRNNDGFNSRTGTSNFHRSGPNSSRNESQNKKRKAG